MKTIIVLAMHGTPPNDFPREELAEFFRLHATIESGGTVDGPAQARYSALDEKMKNWPRNEKNDPFHAASQELAAQLSEASGNEVIVGYNEFCAPDIDGALQSAADRGAGKIIVATPMMTRGGGHVEKEIPAQIAAFAAQHPEIEITYAWPYDTVDVARFLSEHISRFS
jgi:sirohydrochlorin cobaltochelatase